MKLRSCLFLICLLTATFKVVSQEDSLKFKSSFTALPNISYSPDTRLVLGGVMLSQFKPANAGEETRVSNLILSAAFSWKKQTSIETSYTIVFPQEKFIWDGFIQYQHWPESIWGIGPDTMDDDEFLIDYDKIDIKQNLLKKLKPSFYLGPKVHYVNLYKLIFENIEEEPIPAPYMPGNEGSQNLGLGLGVSWDERNSIMTPTRNHYVEFSALFYLNDLFSNHQFQNYSLDIRKYFSFDAKATSVLGFQTLFNFAHGEVPFHEMARLGGNRIMRGYQEGRYRDKIGLQAQTEFRQIIKGRLGLAAFAALGNVAPSPGKVELENTRWTVGTGLRYNLLKRNPTYVRLDYGFGENTGGFYIALGEAF